MQGDKRGTQIVGKFLFGHHLPGTREEPPVRLDERIGLSTNQDSVSGELDMARSPLPTREKSNAEEERTEHQVKDMVSGV